MSSTRTSSPTAAAGVSRPHESAVAQVAGGATYIDDMPELRGTLHAAPILSTVAHGRLLGVDTRAALAMPGVRGVVLSRDIPGDPMLAAFAGDEPVFAMDTVQHIGQVVGLVVADTVMQARRAARKVQLNIDTLPAILSIQDALAAQSFVLPPVYVKRGDAAAALAHAPHTLNGTLEVGGQQSTAASAPTCPARWPTAPSSTATTPTTCSMWTLRLTAASSTPKATRPFAALADRRV